MRLLSPNKLHFLDKVSLFLLTCCVRSQQSLSGDPVIPHHTRTSHWRTLHKPHKVNPTLSLFSVSTSPYSHSGLHRPLEWHVRTRHSLNLAARLSVRDLSSSRAHGSGRRIHGYSTAAVLDSYSSLRACCTSQVNLSSCSAQVHIQVTSLDVPDPRHGPAMPFDSVFYS